MPVELNTRTIQVGSEILFLSIVRDITDHKVAESSLKAVRNQLQALFEYAPEGIFIADLDGRYSDVNQAGCRMLGYSRDELVGKTIIDLIRAEDVPRLMASKADMQAGEADTQEWLLRHKNGALIPTEVSARILQDGRWQGFVRDITERNALNEKLHEKDRMYRALVESSGNGFWACDLQGKIVEANAAYAARSGYSREELLNMSIPDIEAIEQPEETRGHIERLLETGYDRFETFHRTKDGELWPVEIFATYWPQNGGILMVFNTDITERKRVEVELRNLSQALMQAGEGIIITDPAGIIEYVNPAFEKITGYASGETVGKPTSILKSQAQKPQIYKQLWETISSGKRWESTLIDRRKDGSFYPALVSIAPIFEGDKIAHYVSIHKDMTEYQRLEHQLQQAQKQESLGTLVGGIAHDFNNMLAALQGNVFMAMHELDQQQKIRSRLESIENISDKAAMVVRQLLTFAKKDIVEMEQVNLNQLISEGFKLAKTTIPENITHHLDFCSKELMVIADITQLQQAFINLSNNARDAVAEVEHPMIEWILTEYEPDEQFRSEHPTANHHSYAKITVRDNGHGILESHRKAIFDPFFSTKGAKGTGLGLAMVFGSIERHDGFIELESELGVGSAFHIYLPLSEAPDESQSVQAVASVSVAQRHETILLVDDDIALREVAREVLCSMGYSVLSAMNGEEALAIFRQHQQEINLVLTDVIMPGMGGVELAKRLREGGSDIPIILATGYDREHALHGGEVNISRSHLLSKPYAFETLNQLIFKMLNE
ncbi:MAG: hybrid sensor histidine kinase/response regulator [Zetaproteobacteria bacterium CG_4_9_14_3_um_filter_49_83]|nr:MAG: hybrid sensor histidine kinase/response regulator [Zetaproteobacteria bacterium CG_4_9_14_3_um_filter_49_83]